MVKNEERSSSWSYARSAIFVALLVCSVLHPRSDVLASSPGMVVVGSFTVTPDQVAPGQYPAIEARISQAKKTKVRSLSVNIIAVIANPDKRMRSWAWEKVKLSRDEAKTITVPHEYDTSVAGTYRAEIIVYSDDMKHRYASESRLFQVTARQPAETEKLEQFRGKEGVAAVKAKGEPERSYVGVGIYGNALNPAVGGTIYLWPSKYIGLQGLYSTGSFNTYEGRLLVKYGLSSTYSIYGGVGYMHVTTDKDIIGVPTRFEDSGVSGVIGVEITLGKKVMLYIESSAAKIDLDRTVSNGIQTVAASVNYTPVTIGGALVFTLF